MGLVKYTDDKHSKIRDRARILYNERYKLRKKILYLCRKMDIDRDTFMKDYTDDKLAYLKLKSLEYEKLEQDFQ